MSLSAVSRLLIGYAVVLATTGTLVYLYGEHHAPIALVGGIGGGAIVVLLGIFWRRRVLWSKPALATTLGIFTLSFVWRSVEAFAGGAFDTGAILSSLAIVSLFVFVVFLVRLKK
jgi:hypothetical protein